MTRTFVRLKLTVLLAALLLTAGATAQAPPAPAETGSTQRFAATGGPQPATPLGAAELQSLIDTLEDPAQRDQLIATLRALQQAHAEPPPSATLLSDDLVAGLLDAVSTRTEVIRQVSSSILESLDQIPLLFAWLRAGVTDPGQRALWLDIGVRLAVYFGLAALAYLGTALALRPARRSLMHGVTGGLFDRGSRLLVILVLDLVPIVAFALAILVVTLLATIAVVAPSVEARAVAEPLIKAVVLARGSFAVARLIFAPKAPLLRLLPISDAAAQDGFRSTRWLATGTIYGYFVLEAARQLGLPWTLYGFLLHVLFFAVVVMLMTVIVRSRAPLAHAIARLADAPNGALVRRLPWPGLAAIWHLLAAFYVLLVYVVWALKIPGGFQLLFGATLGTGMIVVGCWLALRLIDQLFSRSARPEQDAELRPSGIERRINRYLPIVGGILRVLVWLGAAAALLEVWGLGTVRWLLSEAGLNLGSRLMIGAAIVVVTIIVWEVISLLIERSITEQDEEGNLRLSNRTRTLLNIMRNFLLVFLSLIALFLILSELGLNVAPLLAGAGVIGLAIGFGSQKLVQDIITGMFVLLGDTIRIGDVVEVASRVGVVEQMTMRTVVLREYSGNVHTIPYSAIDTVTNYTKDFSYAVFQVGVAYRESVDQVMDVLREIGAEMNRDPHFRRLILEPLDVAGVDAFADSAVIIKARLKTRPLKQWEVSREFNRRLKNRFDELGIEIPFPHQTVYFGVDKQGQAPPVKVALDAAPAPPDQPPGPLDQTAEPQPMLARSRGA